MQLDQDLLLAKNNKAQAMRIKLTIAGLLKQQHD
jgi:hypothetical protein